MRIPQLTIILLLTFSSCGQREENNEIQISFERLKESPDKYKNLLVTAKELVKDSFYKARDFENYESLEIDTASSAILYMKYRFKVNDTITNFALTIGTLISIEKSEEAAQKTLDIWQSAYDAGFKNSPINQQEIEIKGFDTLLSHSVTSKFVEYTQEGNLLGYALIGRTKHTCYLYNIRSNQIEHHKYIELLRPKIAALADIEDNTKKKNGL